MTKLNEMTYTELERHASEVTAELKRKAYAAGYEQGRFDAELDRIDSLTSEEVAKEVQQDRRDEIVEWAKADIENLKDGDEFYTIHSYACTADFIIDKNNRIIVVLLKGRNSGKVRAVGVAKCHPDDCFNVHIGKAIAIRRALELEVPEEYLNAPQPTKVRFGDVVRASDNDRIEPYKVREIIGSAVIDKDGTWLFVDELEVIDDSREGVDE